MCVAGVRYSHQGKIVTPGQCRAARALLGWTQIDLAKAAGIGQSTVANFERSKLVVAAKSITKMQLALEDAGIEFTDGKRLGSEDEGLIGDNGSVIPRPRASRPGPSPRRTAH